mmetsp:Transcript_89450/g.251943  ORF Transcript_89450/g.251943 Transcript_89450/m.251943 type:complete len:585 (-) Transcript_89450:34-1788(-)
MPELPSPNAPLSTRRVARVEGEMCPPTARQPAVALSSLSRRPGGHGSGVTPMLCDGETDAGDARCVIDTCAHDPEFWSRLLRHEDVLAHMRRTLKAKASRDAAFAGYVLAAAFPAAGSAARRGTCAVDEVLADCRFPGLSACAPAGVGATPAIETPAVRTPARRGIAACSNRKRHDATLAATPALGQASSTKRLRRSATSDGRSHCKGFVSAEVRLPPVHTDIGLDPDAGPCRSLAAAFEAGCESKVLYGCGTPSNRRCAAQGGTRDTSFAPASADVQVPSARENGVFLWPLPLTIAAHVASHLSFREKVGLAPVVRGSTAVLSDASAWEPLVLTRTESACLLRRLRELDPMGSSATEKLPMPAGIFQVKELSVDLMDPDSVELDEGAEEQRGPPQNCGDEVPIATASPSGGIPPGANSSGCSIKFACVLDPLEELSRQFRRGWRSVERLTIANVEDHRLDYRLLHFRTSVLAKFAQVRVLVARGRPARYTVVASQQPQDVARLDVRAAAAENEARRPNELPFQFVPAETFDVAEAAFIKEHTDVFKSGDVFHVAHAPWRTFAGDVVRQRYHAMHWFGASGGVC